MKSSRERNYYELLEVPSRSSVDEIRAAYRRAMERATPKERTEPDQVAELRDLLAKAVGILSDADLRLRYDRSIGLDEVCSGTSGSLSPTQLAMDDLLESAGGFRLRPSEPGLSYAPLNSRASDPQQFHPTHAVGHMNGDGVFNSKPPAELEHAPVLAEESAIANAEAALVHASARGQQLRSRPVEIAPDADFNGELLRQVRESRGLVIQAVAERTRIPVRHLENIEADRYNHLPATVYLRGILMSLARELGLDPARVSRSYIALVGEANVKGR
jgi:curved DNA-binding protein CbpA